MAANNTASSPTDPVTLCERNVRRLGERDIVVAGDPGCGAALVSNIVFELGFDYLDPYTEVLNEDGSVQMTDERLSYYRERLPATAGHGQAEAAQRQPGHDGRRFVKTHLYPEHFRDVPLCGAVLLVRDPRDSVYSSYKWFSGFSKSWWPGMSSAKGEMAFADFLSRRRRGDGETPVSGWARFSEGWLDAAPMFGRFALLRFEDLKTNPVGTITGLLATFGISAPLGVVRTAAERSTFDAMRVREEEASAAEGDSGASSARIMRRGKVGEWREWYGDEGIAERFSDPALHSAAARFGYDLGSASAALSATGHYKHRLYLQQA